MAFRPQTQILPANQQAIWPQLGAAKDLGLVLYGGTAIALRLGHRESIDFDFFTNLPLNKEELRKKLPVLADSVPLQDEKDTLVVLARTVKLSFFGGLNFGRYGSPEVTEDGVLDVASPVDLMALKIKVLFQRSEAKDYLDIAAMIDAGVSLATGLAVAEQMFKPELSTAIALKALTYFEGGDLAILPKSCRKTIAATVARIATLPSIELAGSSLSLRI